MPKRTKKPRPIQICYAGDFASAALGKLEPGESVQMPMFEINARREDNRIISESQNRQYPGEYVYFVQEQSPAKFIKIGYASKLGTRLAALRTNNPYGIELLLAVQGGKKLERFFHRRFAEFRFHGEWFYPVDEILAYVKSVAE